MQQIGPGLWSARGSFKIAHIIDVGTHMSFVQLPSKKFLVIDTVPMTAPLKAQIDQLTSNGDDIEAVIATHPFHSLSFPDFYALYPKAKYFGTPRHLRNLPLIPWVGDLNRCEVRNQWEPTIYTRIPAGAEFVDPKPEKTNHFSCIFVYHPESRTIHVDDTIMCTPDPGFFLRLFGFKKGDLAFHPSIKSAGLHPTKEAPYEFQAWLQKVIDDWDFDNILTAHLGNKIGGAKEKLQQVLNDAAPLFAKVSERNAKKTGGDPPTDQGEGHSYNVQANECG